MPIPASPLTASELPAPVVSLVADPHGAQEAYALLVTGALYHTVDGGETWHKLPLPAPERPVAGPPDPARPNSVPLLPQRDLVVTRVWPGRIFVRVGQDLYRSDEEHRTWKRIQDHVAAWTVDEWHGNVVYAWRVGERAQADASGGCTHGLYKSGNGGERWLRVYRGFFPPQFKENAHAPNHEGITSLLISPTPDNWLYAGAADGLYRSPDGGRTWTRLDDGLPVTTHAYRRVPLLVSGPERQIYALTEATPDKDDYEAQALLARLAHGEMVPDEDRWVATGADALDALADVEQGFWGVHTLVADPRWPDRLYLGTVRGLWISDDAGETWQVVDLPDAGAVYRIAVVPGKPTHPYLWTDAGFLAPVFSLPSALPETIPDKVRLEIVGQLGGGSRVVAIGKETIYLGVGPRIVGLGDTLPLAALGDVGVSPVLPGLVNDIALGEDGQVAYVAAGDAGLLVADVTFLPDARVVGAVQTPDDAQAVIARDGLAYVAEGRWAAGGGLSIVDVSDPHHPKLLASLKMPRTACAVALVGHYAYVAYGTGLVVIDISDPANPVEVARVRPSQSVTDVASMGGYAYMVGDGVRVMDVSDPAQPREVGSFADPGPAWDAVAVAGDYAYAVRVFCEFGLCGSTMLVLDVSDPSNPREVGSWMTDGSVADIAVTGPASDASGETLSGGIVYLATWQKDVLAVDVADPSNPRLLDAYGTLGQVYDVVVSDGFAYVGDAAESGLHVLDLAGPRGGRFWPHLRGTAEPLRWVSGHAVVDGYAYVPAWEDGFRVIDVRNPDDPRELGMASLQMAQRAVVEGNLAYVTAGYGGLFVLDVSEPSTPRILGRLSLEGFARGLGVRGGYAYVAVDDDDRDAFCIVDARDPGALHLAGTAAIEGEGLRVTLAGDHAYVAVYDCSSWGCRGGVQAVNVSDPAQPQAVGLLALPEGAFDVAVSGRYAFIAGGTAGVYVADLSDPVDLQPVGFADTPGRATRVFVDDDKIYVADEAGGLLIMGIE